MIIINKYMISSYSYDVFIDFSFAACVATATVWSIVLCETFFQFFFSFHIIIPVCDSCNNNSNKQFISHEHIRRMQKSLWRIDEKKNKWKEITTNNDIIWNMVDGFFHQKRLKIDRRTRKKIAISTEKYLNLL